MTRTILGDGLSRTSGVSVLACRALALSLRPLSKLVSALRVGAQRRALLGMTTELEGLEYMGRTKMD